MELEWESIDFNIVHLCFASYELMDCFTGPVYLKITSMVKKNAFFFQFRKLRLELEDEFGDEVDIVSNKFLTSV